MRLRNWLLTGTGIGLLALAPISAHAQDAALQSAYQAYLDAQASGDAAAVEAAQGSLTELCIVGGFASLDACIAGLSAPAPEAAPAPAPEAAPAEPAAEAPAPAPEAAPTAEEPAPVTEEAPPAAAEPAPAAEEPAPPAEATPPAAEEPAPAAEEPAPAVEEPAPEPAPVEEAAPTAEEPAAPEAVAPAEPVAPEAAPEPDVQAAPEAAPAEEPAPEEAAPADQQAAPEAAAGTDQAAEIAAQVDAYNGALADLMAGGEATDAQARLDAARGEIARLCAEAGFASTEECLAEYGLELPPVPALDNQGEPSAETAPAEDGRAAPGDEQPAPVETSTPDGQPAELVEDLPEGVSPEQIAPVLDSAKDVEDGQAPAGETEAAPPAPAEPAAPPPQSDAAAQAELQVPQDAAFSAVAEEGEAVEASAIEPTVPQNVTIINQTNITNNVSTGDNSSVTIGQQTNQTTEAEQNRDGGRTDNGRNGGRDRPRPVQPASPAEAITQVIMQIGTQLVVNSIGQDTNRFYDPQQDEVFYERLSNDRVRETITRPDGSQVVTVRNRNGDILRRSRITPDGREIVLNWFDDRYYDDLANWRDPGADLPPLRLTIPVREYVLDAEYADENEVADFFSQPPVEQVTRLYSIDEVKRSARIRDTVRRLEVGNLTFDTGSANIGRDQVANLSKVANAMLDLLERNPAETFLIEGHTDAVGSDVSNLGLSDLRAATVARILTDFYGVPPENLATQGYGERYLKIRTEAAERENRRVTIRRITPLVTVAGR